MYIVYMTIHNYTWAYTNIFARERAYSPFLKTSQHTNIQRFSNTTSHVFAHKNSTESHFANLQTIDLC